MKYTDNIQFRLENGRVSSSQDLLNAYVKMTKYSQFQSVADVAIADAVFCGHIQVKEKEIMYVKVWVL